MYKSKLLSFSSPTELLNRSLTCKSCLAASAPALVVKVTNPTGEDVLPFFEVTFYPKGKWKKKIVDLFNINHRLIKRKFLDLLIFLPLKVNPHSLCRHEIADTIP